MVTEFLIWTKGPKVTSTKCGSPRHSCSQHFSASCLWSLVLAPVSGVIFSRSHSGMLPLSQDAWSSSEPDSSSGSHLHFTFASAIGTLTPFTVDFFLSIGSPESREGNQIPLKHKCVLKKEGEAGFSRLCCLLSCTKISCFCKDTVFLGMDLLNSTQEFQASLGTSFHCSKYPDPAILHMQAPS